MTTAKAMLLAAASTGLLAAAPACAQSLGTASGVADGSARDQPNAGQQASATQAAAASAAETGGALDAADIVVTARRREERLQDVPLAVTALSGRELQQRGVVKLEDIRLHAPALQIEPSPYGAVVPAFSIRGQHQQEGLITQDPSVGVYVDEVYQARAHGVNQVLLDLDNVQVVKGPQGTLFGRNTSGGALLVTSKRPTDRFEGEVSAGFGNYAQRELSAIVNVPVADGLAVRVAGKYSHRDGYVTNVADGARQGDENNYVLRVGARYHSGGFDNYGVVAATRLRGTGVGFVSQGFGPITSVFVNPAAVAAANAAQARRGFYQTTGDQSPYPTRVTTLSATNVTTIDLGGATLKNVFGYRRVHSLVSVEFDGSNLKANNGLPFFNAANFLREHQFSEELQLQGKLLDDRLSYVLGGYLFREKGSDFQQTVLGAFGLAQTGGGFARNDSRSVFAQADLKITSRLTATGGVRYSWDRRHFTGQTYFSGLVAAGVTPAINYGGNPPPVSCNDGGTLANACRVVLPTYRRSTPTWLATLSYRPSRSILVYGTVSRGYRSGGWNLRGALAANGSAGTFGPFRPEIVTNYEGGVKLDLRIADVPVTLNLAGYHQQYRNIQRSIYAQFPGRTVAQANILNAATAKIDGAEAELTVRPAAGLQLSANAGYVDARYSRFSYVVAARLDGSGTAVVDGSNFPFAGVPKFQWGATAHYDVRTGADVGTPSVQLSYYHQSRIAWQDAGIADGGLSRPYGLADLRLGWRDVLGKPVSLGFFVRNLFDKQYKALGSSGYSTTGFISYMPGTPRLFGGTVEVRF